MGKTQWELLSQLRAEAPGAAAQAASSGGTLCYGTRVRWLSDPRACFETMLADLRQAEKSIWLAAPSISPGVMWETILAVLRRKAAEGVEVRLLYGRYESRLPLNYVNQLSFMHIRARALRRAGPFCTLILDGVTGCVGSLDIRDAQIGLRCRRRTGRTAMLRLQGAAAGRLRERFLPYFPDAQTVSETPPTPDYCYTAFFPDARQVIPSLIARAEHSVLLLAPGPVPGRISEALRLAAASGIEACLIVAKAPLRRLPGVQIACFPGGMRGCVCCADGQTAALTAGREGVWLHGRGAPEIDADLRAMFDALHPGAYSGWKGRFCTWSRAFPDR